MDRTPSESNTSFIRLRTSTLAPQRTPDKTGPVNEPIPQSQPSHEELILDQFTRQAEAFATAPAITNAAALDLLVKIFGAGPMDTVLDVACGAGVVVCAFAEVVRHATGIDLTPAMIERA